MLLLDLPFHSSGRLRVYRDENGPHIARIDIPATKSGELAPSFRRHDTLLCEALDRNWGFLCSDISGVYRYQEHVLNRVDDYLPLIERWKSEIRRCYGEGAILDVGSK